MQSFRNLANNILFKIFLAFIALAFVLFGVSGFVLNGPDIWVAKVGNKTISQSAFLKELQKNHSIISQTNQTKEAVEYLNSPRFKSDVANRMVNDLIISKLREDLGVHASEELILQQVAKDDSFKGLNGKFDRELFKQFLKKNGLNQKEYVELIKNQVAAALVMQSLTAASPVNEEVVIAMEEFKRQTRLADVVTIKNSNINKVATPTSQELEAFYNETKQNYAAPEMRNITYITFSKDDIASNITVSDEEIEAEYANNEQAFQKPETRDLYHVSFDKKEDAQTFARKLDIASDVKAEFVKLAKTLAKKDQKEITLAGISDQDLMPELSNVIFKLNLNKRSEVVESPLGFHVFLLNNITPRGLMKLADVRDDIEAQLIAQKESTQIQDKVSAIDDTILTSNSLAEVAKKFDLKVSDAVTISADGKDKNGKDVAAIQSLEGFASNAFALNKNDASKLFYSQSSDAFYVVKVQDIEAAHNRDLKEVEALVKADLTQKRQSEALRKFAEKVRAEIVSNPSNIRNIASKYRLSLDKDKEFPRTFYINYQGRQIPYASPFLEALFDLEVGDVTQINAQGADLSIAVVKYVKTLTLTDEEIEAAKKAYAEGFKRDIAQTYNAFVMKKHPIALNEQVFANQEE